MFCYCIAPCKQKLHGLTHRDKAGHPNYVLLFGVFLCKIHGKQREGGKKIWMKMKNDAAHDAASESTELAFNSVLTHTRAKPRLQIMNF